MTFLVVLYLYIFLDQVRLHTVRNLKFARQTWPGWQLSVASERPYSAVCSDQHEEISVSSPLSPASSHPSCLSSSGLWVWTANVSISMLSSWCHITYQCCHHDVTSYVNVVIMMSHHMSMLSSWCHIICQCCPHDVISYVNIVLMMSYHMSMLSSWCHITCQCCPATFTINNRVMND